MERKPNDHRQRRPKGEPRPRLSRRRRHWIVALVLAVLVVGGGGGAWFWNGARAAPEPAPKFNLLSSAGRIITINEFLGKQEFVLIFYMDAG